METVMFETLLFDPTLTRLIAREDLVHGNLLLLLTVATYFQNTHKYGTLQTYHYFAIICIHWPSLSCVLMNQIDQEKSNIGRKVQGFLM
jgi:hypothetical protein